MLWRYRARHFPESLDAIEAAEWVQWREKRLLFAPDGGLSLDDYEALLRQLRAHVADEAGIAVLDALAAWGQRLRGELAAGH